MKQTIQCDVCQSDFVYEIWATGRDNYRPADELPDGYNLYGKWICHECGSCSNCKKSLEKTGNMLDAKPDKICIRCKIENEV